MSTEALLQAFPECDPGVLPLGSRVLVQIRTPEEKSKGGIILSHNDQETTFWNTTVAKVISAGPLAFHSRNTQTLWPEGAWCKPGDYIRAPKYGGDRWKAGEAYFMLINDLDILGLVTVDPLSITAFI